MVIAANSPTLVMFYIDHSSSQDHEYHVVFMNHMCTIFYWCLLLFTAVVVGFERLVYTLGEGDGQAELCVNITMPRQQDIGTVTFNITVETQNRSAGIANNRNKVLFM